MTRQSNTDENGDRHGLAIQRIERGDVVRLPSAPEWQQPFTVTVEYQGGTVRLEDTHGAPVVSVERDRLEVAR